MNDPIINVGHLTKKYQDVKAVDDLSLLINKGELFGLLGPNGAGKTIIINIYVEFKNPQVVMLKYAVMIVKKILLK